MRWVALVAIVLVATGCSSRQPAKSVVPSHDCFDAWNADGNERNRSDLAARGFPVGRVSNGTMIADVAAPGTPQTTSLCGYLFHSESRFVSYTGAWSGNGLRWTNSAAAHGAWSANQQKSQADDIRVLDGGRIAKR